MGEKDNIITKFRDAMGFMATHASPIGGYLSSKVRQGLNNAISKPMKEKNNPYFFKSWFTDFK